MLNHAKQILMKHIFFDLDGTLHKEDILREFIKYLIKNRKLNLFFFFPLLPFAFLIYKILPTKKWSLNCLLFLITFGSSRLDTEQYLTHFKSVFIPTALLNVQEVLKQHIEKQDKIWIISGSPVELIEIFYSDLLKHPQINLIGSHFTYKYRAILLKERCIAQDKVKMLDRKVHPQIQFDIGYSDNMSDLPIFRRCNQAVKISKDGTFVIL